jgi:hypothetical protein
MKVSWTMPKKRKSGLCQETGSGGNGIGVILAGIA